MLTSMKPNSYYPVIATTDVAGTVAFYTKYFPFQPGFETDWYVHLVWDGDPRINLAVIDHTHSSIPSTHQVPSAGVILTFEVADATAEYHRLREAGLGFVTELVDEPWGQRHFIIEDPNGLLIDIAQPIEPAPEFAASYTLSPPT